MDNLTPSGIYALSTSAYLTIQSLPLLLTPSLITSLLSPDPRRPTDLETYFCRALGLSLLTLAATILPLTGILPTASPSKQAQAEKEDATTDPYASPTVITTSTYHALNAFYLYTQLAPGSWNFGFTAGITLSGTLFCFGLWVMMFGGDKGRTSKKTGADKRTANFPFTNAESSREKRKEAKAEGKVEKEKRRSMARTKSRDY
ncbi:uncharacterized protein LTR77_006512 [Saxophila tyrrhenica]|uniref:Uncharacterized protein n=1 Tax=Saxophila tyrrhenica TaxID=1690608 RepID=A0AAV9P4U3_9PEZI|nr:hypothetical protein LTR77_006512 [Saxophila tyrrhenica]